LQAKAAILNNPIASKIYDYGILVKFKLTSYILMSAAAGYVLAYHDSFNLFKFIGLLIGGFLVTGSSNAINQIIERNLDALMDRTANRPLPAERMSLLEAMIAAGVAGIMGVMVLWFYCNELTGVIGALALLSYAFVYTPMKRISPVSVWVGAIPGALPPMIGVVAASGSLNMMAWAIFGIQFLWQFPHYWAIAWVVDEDYAKAGFKMLPSKEGRDKITALFSISYSLLLIPIGLLPTYMGWCGNLALIVNTLCGLMMCAMAIKLYFKVDTKSAKGLMFASFIYHPLVMLMLMIDKI
jgi:heme o synthase